jgi:hypothetical protein
MRITSRPVCLCVLDTAYLSCAYVYWCWSITCFLGRPNCGGDTPGLGDCQVSLIFYVVLHAHRKSARLLVCLGYGISVMCLCLLVLIYYIYPRSALLWRCYTGARGLSGKSSFSGCCTPCTSQVRPSACVLVMTYCSCPYVYWCWCIR